MHFWIVNAQEHPAEPRQVVKRREWRSNTLSETLADRGHEVVRWRSAFSHHTKDYLSQGSRKVPHDNYHHQFIDGPPYQRHIGLSRILHHRALGRNFFRIAANYATPPDLIHVGNVPIALASAAVSYGKQNKVPVMVDIRDLWPDIYVDLIPQILSALRPPALTALHAGAFGLKTALRDAGAISALTPPFLDWALQLAGRQANRNDVVFEMCYPVQPAAPKGDIATLRERLCLHPDHVVACYAGTIGHQVDVKTLLTAARKLEAEVPLFRMVIAGGGPALDELKSQAADLQNVVAPGWLSGTELGSLMAVSSIGLISYHPVPAFLRSISNKFPEYLANGLAISCGQQGEMGRIVDEHDCGFTYEPRNGSQLAEELARLVNNPKRLSEMGARARGVHRDRFDGARLYPKFAEHLERIAKDGLRPSSAT